MENGRVRNEEYQIQSFAEDQESHILWLVLDNYYGSVVSLESVEICPSDHSEERKRYY